MLVKDLEFKEAYSPHGNTLVVAKLPNNGKISVLNRLTGWGDGDIRDTETGYRAPTNKFWLASGNFDIRDFPGLTAEEAVEMIKANANVCIGL